MITVHNMIIFGPNRRIQAQGYPAGAVFATVDCAFGSVYGNCSVDPDAIDANAIDMGGRARFLDTMERTKNRIVMALNFFNATFIHYWNYIPAELKGIIVSYAPMPVERPMISNFSDLMGEIRRISIWYQLSLSDYHLLHQQLLMRCRFLAERDPHTADNLASLIGPNPSCAQMRGLLASKPTLLRTPNPIKFGQHVQDLTIPLRLTDSEIRILRLLPRRFGSLMKLCLLFNLELFRGGNYLVSDQAPADPNAATPLAPDFQALVEEKLAGPPVKFSEGTHGIMAMHFGLVHDNFHISERENLRWLHRRLHEFFHFQKGCEAGERPDAEHVIGSATGDDLDRLSFSIDKWDYDTYDTAQLWLTRGPM